MLAVCLGLSTLQCWPDTGGGGGGSSSGGGGGGGGGSNETGQNQAPSVNAGVDRNLFVSLPTSINLNGQASDDGKPNPPGALSIEWTFVSGPASVFFDNSTLINPAVSFSSAGNYVLRLSANDGVYTGSDELNVQITEAPPPPPLPATTLFVDSSLSGTCAGQYNPDLGAGSRCDPGGSYRAYKTMQAAMDAAVPGDTIFVRGGTYIEGYLGFAKNGQPNAPITVEGYQNEEVLLSSGSGAHNLFSFDPTDNPQMAGWGYYNFRKLKGYGSRHMFRFDYPLASQTHHITVEDCEAWNNASNIGCRSGGVSFLTVRRCKFSGATGTEGGVDLGNNTDLLDTPQAGSHDVLFEDTDFFENNSNQQCNGIVCQGSTYNITLRRCRAWNNGKYGFALKGSGNFLVDRCTAWGNGSTQLYLRGFVETDPPDRAVSALNSHLVTNCVIIGPRDSSGGTIVWRECTNLRMYNCTVVALRDESTTNSGWPFTTGERANPPDLAIQCDLRNCIFATYDGTITRFDQGGSLPYWRMRKYQADNNLFFKYGGGSTTLFRYQNNLWTTLDKWKAYWAVGEINGDDMMNGPTATHADANSLWGDPKFEFIETNIELVPIAKAWPADPISLLDVRVETGSAAINAGANLKSLGIPELNQDYFGHARPDSAAWTIGAAE